MKTVIIDNYDSFTYNLAHLVKELGAEVDVLRNDKFRLEELEPYDKSSSHPAPVSPRKPDCCWMSSAPMPDGNPYSVSVWANKPSDKCLAESWSIWKRYSMGYRRR